MCGIFGFISDRQSGFDKKNIRPLLNKLFMLSETRGKDAAGLALISEQAVKVLKRPVRANMEKVLRWSRRKFATLRSEVPIR